VRLDDSSTGQGGVSADNLAHGLAPLRAEAHCWVAAFSAFFPEVLSGAGLWRRSSRGL
jgi:hypothetical protein